MYACTCEFIYMNEIISKFPPSIKISSIGQRSKFRTYGYEVAGRKQKRNTPRY